MDIKEISKYEHGGTMVNDLQNSAEGVSINNSSTYHIGTGYDSETNTLNYDRRPFTVDKVLAHDFVTLGHEMAHAWADMIKAGGQYTGKHWLVKRSEIFAVRFENYLRAMSGETSMRMEYTGYTLGHSYDASTPEYFKNFTFPYRTGEIIATRVDGNKELPGAVRMDNTYHKPHIIVTEDSRKKKITTTSTGN